MLVGLFQDNPDGIMVGVVVMVASHALTFWDLSYEHFNIFTIMVFGVMGVGVIAVLILNKFS